MQHERLFTCGVAGLLMTRSSYTDFWLAAARLSASSCSRVAFRAASTSYGKVSKSPADQTTIMLSQKTQCHVSAVPAAVAEWRFSPASTSSIIFWAGLHWVCK